MATSGTTTFDLAIDEIVEEAFERCGIQTNSGYDLRTARRSLNILFSEWGNRGVHLWKVALYAQALTSGTSTYDSPASTADILEAYVSNNASTVDPASSTQDVSITKISRSEYAALPNKGATGSPSKYYVERLTTPKITLYLTPDASTYTHLKYYYVKKIEDSGAYTNTADVVYRFIPAMCAGLAYYLAIKYAPQRIQMLKQLYEDEMARALTEDGQRTSAYITPASYYPQGS